MIQRRTPDPSTWSADPTVSLNNAVDLQSLLEAVVRRYRLLGGVIADNNGAIQAQTGGAVQDLQSLAAAIDVRVLPRYYANGPLDAYVDIVGPNYIALLMRERPDGEEGRTELGMVSDYNIAKQMTEELRVGILRIQGQ